MTEEFSDQRPRRRLFGRRRPDEELSEGVAGVSESTYELELEPEDTPLMVPDQDPVVEESPTSATAESDLSAGVHPRSGA